MCGSYVLNAFRQSEVCTFNGGTKFFSLYVCSTPFGNQRFVLDKVKPCISVTITCSTPFGNQRFVLAPALQAANISSVLNAFRQSEVCTSCNSSRTSVLSCAQRLSAIRGLYPRIRQIVIPKTSVLNAFRQSEVCTVIFAIFLRLHFMVLNAFRQSEVCTQMLDAGFGQFRTCSTPFGNQRFVLSLLAVMITKNSGAQRLSAIRGLYYPPSPRFFLVASAQRLSAIRGLYSLSFGLFSQV